MEIISFSSSLKVLKSYKRKNLNCFFEVDDFYVLPIAVLLKQSICHDVVEVCRGTGLARGPYSVRQMRINFSNGPGREVRDNFINGTGRQIRSDFSNGPANRKDFSNWPGRQKRNEFSNGRAGLQKEKKKGTRIILCVSPSRDYKDEVFKPALVVKRIIMYLIHKRQQM